MGKVAKHKIYRKRICVPVPASSQTFSGIFTRRRQMFSTWKGNFLVDDVEVIFLSVFTKYRLLVKPTTRYWKYLNTPPFITSKIACFDDFDKQISFIVNLSSAAPLLIGHISPVQLFHKNGGGQAKKRLQKWRSAFCCFDTPPPRLWQAGHVSSSCLQHAEASVENSAAKCLLTWVRSSLR